MAPKKVTPAGRAAPAPEAAPAKKSAKKKASTSQKKAATSTSRYVRNLHYAAGGVRVDLGEDRRIHLEPRGQVGDLIPVSAEDRDHPLYQRNIGILFEEISKAEATDIIDKQNTNAQSPRQTTMDHIRNEKGEEYTNPATITRTYESQGQVVGQVSSAAEGVSSNNTGNIQRQVTGPAEVQVPGSRQLVNAMPEGLTEPQAIEYLNTPPEQRADFLARIRGAGEAGAAAAAETYRDSLRVSVEPTRREE